MFSHFSCSNILILHFINSLFTLLRIRKVERLSRYPFPSAGAIFLLNSRKVARHISSRQNRRRAWFIAVRSNSILAFALNLLSSAEGGTCIRGGFPHNSRLFTPIISEIIHSSRWWPHISRLLSSTLAAVKLPHRMRWGDTSGGTWLPRSFRGKIRGLGCSSDPPRGDRYRVTGSRATAPNLHVHDIPRKGTLPDDWIFAYSRIFFSRLSEWDVVSHRLMDQKEKGNAHKAGEGSRDKSSVTNPMQREFLRIFRRRKMPNTEPSVNDIRKLLSRQIININLKAAAIKAHFPASFCIYSAEIKPFRPTQMKIKNRIFYPRQNDISFYLGESYRSRRTSLSLGSGIIFRWRCDSTRCPSARGEKFPCSGNVSRSSRGIFFSFFRVIAPAEKRFFDLLRLIFAFIFRSLNIIFLRQLFLLLPFQYSAPIIILFSSIALHPFPVSSEKLTRFGFYIIVNCQWKPSPHWKIHSSRRFIYQTIFRESLMDDDINNFFFRSLLCLSVSPPDAVSSTNAAYDKWRLRALHLRE